MSYVVTIRQRAKANVSAAMFVWSAVMMAVLVAWELSPGHEATVYLWGIVATGLFGAYLGWQRRVGAVFFAPLVSWSLAIVPLWIAAMVRHGFIKGFFVGLFLVSVGWLAIGTAEFLELGAVTLLVRAVRGRGPSDGEVVIIGPGGEV